MKKVFVINGSGGSGKDTFVERVSKYAKVDNFSSIDIIKSASRVLGWDGAKTDKDRKFLSDMKDLAIQYNDAPLVSCMNHLDEFMSGNKEILFIHIREIPEIKKFLKSAESMLIEVQTVLVTNSHVSVIQTNKSDAGVFDYQYDIIIENNGTLDDLDNKAKSFAFEYTKD
jgi:hypothetical protein